MIFFVIYVKSAKVSGDPSVLASKKEATLCFKVKEVWFYLEFPLIIRYHTNKMDLPSTQ